jgi:RHS repeat-associated protein
MPAELPSTSAFTYCVSLSVDGAERVKFDSPVTLWVDNFLEFPVGSIAPLGYYNSDKGLWMPQPNGLIVELLDTDGNGVVDALDSNGDQAPDDLNGDGSMSDEVRGLNDGQIYAAGSTFMRAKITHFSAYDFNWPFGLPPGWIDPNPKALANVDEKVEKDPYLCTGSYVEQKSRIFHEDIPIPGTDIRLHYDSSRTAGYLPGVITIPASGDAIPEFLMEIWVQANIAGREYRVILPAAPNQVAEFEWDGLDHLGKPVTGSVLAHIKIGFIYSGVYFAPATTGLAFGQRGSGSIAVQTRIPVPAWKEYTVPILRGKGSLAEGWTISSHHYVDPASPSILFKGDGTISRNNAVIIETVVGTGVAGYSGDGGPAAAARINLPGSLYIDSDNKLYFSDIDNGAIRMIDANSVIQTVLRAPTGDIAFDSQGSMYYPNGYNLWKLSPNGVNTKIGGNYHSGYAGDGGPVNNAQFSGIGGVYIDSAGNLYLADVYNHRIRMVDTAGIVTTVAGNGQIGHGGDGGPARAARLSYPYDVFGDDRGNLYIVENDRIRKVDASGIIRRFAGPGQWNVLGDGGPATEAFIREPRAVTVDQNGNVYILEYGGQRLRKVDTNGIITTVAGSGGNGSYGGDGGSATAALFNSPNGLAADAEGNLYISDGRNHRIRKVSLPALRLRNLMDDSDYAFTDEGDIGYILSPAGLHKNSVDLATGITMLTFNYDENNELVSITDQYNNEITIEYDGGGLPSAVISPDGVRANLTISANNHLTRITYADGSYHEFEYSPDGLMTSKIEPEGNWFERSYDDNGRLIELFDQEGGHWSHTRTVEDTGEVRVEMTTAENNVTSFIDSTVSTGAHSSIMVDPAGTTAEFNTSGDGLTESQSLPCGTDLLFHYGIDPEYKSIVLKDVTENTPAGLRKMTARAKTYQDTDADQVPDLISETIKVNNKQTSIVNNVLESQKIITSPEGRTITLHYGPDTLLTETVSIPGLYDINYGYDQSGRLTSTNASTRQTIFAYDAQGFLESVTDPENHTTIYSYDPVGRITGIRRPDGGYVGFTYDKNGNMKVLTNPVDIDHGFGYTKVNLNSSYMTPISGSYSYLYNGDRQLIRTSLPSGKQIINIYDKTRLAQIQTPEGNIDYVYLCGTKVGSISKGAESITYAYDGKLVTSETLSGTLNHSLNYTYNSDFNVTGFTYAGSTVNYVYDNDRLLIGSGSCTITRNALNGLPEEVAGGTLSIDKTFNGYGELDAQDVAVDNQNVASWGLTRNNSGRINAKTETIDGITTNYIYTYDSMGRLETVTRDSALVEEYGYDLNGTRTYEMNILRGISGRSFGYSDEDHLLTAGATAYAYDQDGFLATKTDGTDVSTYGYSSRGELIRVNLPDGRAIEYLHDPLGRRIAKKVDGMIVEKYLWQGLTRLLAVYDGSDNLLMRFEYADDRMPMAMTAAGITYYLTYDQVGSLRVVADAAGDVVKRIDYDSFGNILNDTNPSFEVPFGFAGGLHDRDTGLVRFGYRDYDPDTGRWTAKDPIFFSGGDTDLYGYVLNDPVNLVDPYGLWEIPGKDRPFPGYRYCGCGNIGGEPTTDYDVLCQEHDICYKKCNVDSKNVFFLDPGQGEGDCQDGCDDEFSREVRNLPAEYLLPGVLWLFDDREAWQKMRRRGSF